MRMASNTEDYSIKTGLVQLSVGMLTIDNLNVKDIRL
jgi:hypothetical protein